MLVSYAQNFEDVILWRALHDVESGFYIDIGAQDPTIESVSLAFYEKGWRGVHVEPIPFYAAKLTAARPDEEVIEAAIASTPGRLTIHDFPDTGLSTGRSEIAERHGASGLTSKPIEVDTLRLSDVFDRHADKEIHWLKIDVEGMEAEAIASWEPSPARPWVLVIESTMPRSQEPDHFEWEPAILAMGYAFVYFDGLNRFYVHQDHAGLRDAFGVGPNIFDDFVLSGTAPYAAHLGERAAGLASQLRATEEQRAGDMDRLLDEIAKKDAEADRLRLSAEERDEVYGSDHAGLARRAALLEKEGLKWAEEIDRLQRQVAETEKIYESDRTSLTERNTMLERLSREKAAELDWFHHHIAEIDKAFAAERAALTERSAMLEKLKQEKDDEIGRLLQHGAQTEKTYAVEQAVLTERATSLEKLAEEKDGRIAQLNEQIASTLNAYEADRATMHERAALLEQAIRKRDADIGRLRRRISAVERAYESERSSLRERVAQANQHEAVVDRLMAAHQAEIVQMTSARHEAGQESAGLVSGIEVMLAERNEQLAENAEALETAVTRMAELDRHLAGVHTSISWRVTAPLRAASRGARATVRWPRSATTNFLHHSLLWLCRRPRALALVRRGAAVLPFVEQRALTFARARADSLPQAEEGWMIEPAAEALVAWQTLLGVPISEKG